MNEPIITKYRPTEWGQFIGNETAIYVLVRRLKSSTCPHAFLFTGPSGVGKTTAARIVATELGADIHEVDAASNNGVEAMRALVEFSQHMSFTGSGRRMLIIDECHTLSKPAWQAILKLLEEPPEHLYISLCTTELSKVPETVLTRAYHTALKRVTGPEMTDFLLAICDLEDWKPTDEILELVTQVADGSLRMGLNVMSAIHDAPNRNEALRIISLVEAGDDLKELLQLLIKGHREWKRIRLLLLKVQTDFSDETAIQAGRYICAALVNTENSEQAARIWTLLDALLFPSDTWDKRTAFVTAIGRMLWAQ